MKALLLAAGKGTRLGVMSQTCPKCLQMVGKEPLIDRLIHQLRAVGVREFLVNTHHLAPLVRSHLEARSDRQRFKIVFEPELLGTLGTLRRNADFFGGEPGWVLHADNLITGDLRALKRCFDSRPHGCIGALLTFQTEDPSSCGVVLTNLKGMVTEFVEKSDDPPSRQASAATFIFDPSVFELARHMPLSATDLSRDLLPQLANRLIAVPHDAAVIDIGTVRGLELARAVAAQEGENFP